MLTRLLLLLLLAIHLAPARALDLDVQAREWLAKKPVVRIGIIADNAPYSTVRAGRVEGFSVDVLDEIARLTGLRFDYRAGSWPEIYAAFERGDLDAIDEISWREDRTAFTLFTEPYHHRQTVIVQDINRPLPPIRTLEDLKPFRVGLVSNIYYKSAFASRGIAANEYDGLPNLLRALAFGWVDAIVGPELTLAYLARQEGLNQLKLAARVPMDGFELEDFRIGVRKEQPQAHRAIAAGLAAISPERFAEMLATWQEYGGRMSQAETAFRLTPAQADYVRRLGAVRVGIARDYAPFSFVDGGKPQGLALDVLARVQDLTGLKALPVADRWPVLIDMLRRGEIDIVSNISQTPERLEFARFSDAYHIIPNVAFTRDANWRLQNLADLEGRRIALGADIFFEPAMRARFGNAVVAFSSQDAMFHALAEGSVDVVLASLQNGNHWVRELKLTDIRIAGELPLDDHAGEDLRFGVRPALEPLVDILNRALTAISPTERRTIENRWLGASVAGAGQPRPTLSESERAWLARHQRIVLCVDPDWMPLEGVDRHGRHVGIAADYLERMSRALGIATEVLPTRSWQESIEAAQARRCDMYSMAMQTPQRLIYMDFTTPYYTTPNVLLARIEAPFLDGLDDFAGKRVGIVSGYAFAELLRVRHPRLQLEEVPSERIGLTRLQRGELDGYIGTLATVNHHLRDLGFADIKVIGRVPGDWALSLATRNDMPELLSIAQKMVDSLGDDDRREIENRWHGIQIEERIDTALLWRWGGAIAVLLLLLFLWIRKLGKLNRQLAAANAQLAQLSVTDALTQIGNRKHFDQEYPPAFRWSQRHQTGFAVAMIDIDHFKRINDTHGHAVGDECLHTLAECLRGHLRRETDRLARFGGEEFVAFMPCENTHELVARFEALRDAVEHLRIPAGATTLSFTISIGLATGIPHAQEQPAVWLKRADDALYAAKRGGRNRVELALAGAR